MHRIRFLVRTRPLALFLVVLGFVSLPVLQPAQAQGFGVYEQGSCVMARAGTAAGQGCADGSSMYFNPAHLTEMDDLTITGGATVINATGSFTYDYYERPPYTGVEIPLQNDAIPIPHLYATYGVSDRVSVGLGTYAPYGLESRWPLDLDGETFFDGAFEGYNSFIQALYIQPTAAYQLTDRLTIGGGPILAVSSVELNQVLDLAAVQVMRDGQQLTLGQLGVAHHTAFASSSLEASGATGFGANVGVAFRVSDRIRVGVRATTPITVSYDGEATFQQVNSDELSSLVFVPPSPLSDVDGDGIPDRPVTAEDLVRSRFQSDGVLTDQTVETKITFPAQAVVGASVQATESLLLLVDYQYTRWSSFDTIPLEFEKLGEQVRIENFKDTHALRFGGGYQVDPRLTLRAGYLYNTAASPDAVVTPLLPEAERHHATLGFGLHLTGMTEINVSYQRLLQTDRRGRVRGPTEGEPPTTALNNGLYEFGAHLFGATLTLHL